MSLLLCIISALAAACLSKKTVTSKEFQWRHDPSKWSLDRRAWLKEFKEFWEDDVANGGLQLSGPITVASAWNDPAIQRYTYFDTADSLVRQHSASLVLRQEVYPLASAPTFTVKFNFRDSSLAHAFPMSSVKDGRSKVEEDVYPCYSKYGRSDKTRVQTGFEPSSFADLKTYFKDPGQWFTATIDPIPSSVDNVRLLKAGPSTYHYIISFPIKLGSISTKVVLTAWYETLQDALMGGNATIVESSVRIDVGRTASLFYLFQHRT